MNLPPHDLWLRDVLDQQLVGNAWTQVQRGFEAMLAADAMFARVWRTPRWAAPDRDVDINTASLSSIPADVKVIGQRNGPDGSIVLHDDLFLGCLTDDDAYSLVLAKGTEMRLEIGNVSPLLVYQELTTVGRIARFPYDPEVPGLDPHLFVIVCLHPKEYRREA